jgi:hypothetical protein
MHERTHLSALQIFAPLTHAPVHESRQRVDMIMQAVNTLDGALTRALFALPAAYVSSFKPKSRSIASFVTSML